jgi:hypothetical protein
MFGFAVVFSSFINNSWRDVIENPVLSFDSSDDMWWVIFCLSMSSTLKMTEQSSLLPVETSYCISKEVLEVNTKSPESFGSTLSVPLSKKWFGKKCAQEVDKCKPLNLWSGFKMKSTPHWLPGAIFPDLILHYHLKLIAWLRLNEIWRYHMTSPKEYVHWSYDFITRVKRRSFSLYYQTVQHDIKVSLATHLQVNFHCKTVVTIAYT